MKVIIQLRTNAAPAMYKLHYVWFEVLTSARCDALQSDRSPLKFRRSVLPPSSGSKNKASNKPTNFLLVLAFLTLRPWRWRQYVGPKYRWTSACCAHCKLSTTAVALDWCLLVLSTEAVSDGGGGESVVPNNHVASTLMPSWVTFERHCIQGRFRPS
jgi:hypothetical protein